MHLLLAGILDRNTELWKTVISRAPQKGCNYKELRGQFSPESHNILNFFWPKGMAVCRVK